jgi:predicted nuclease of restriction endonuclease-like RecB superfamily
MIPQEYLRVKISNKGNNIAPVFCTSDNDLLLLANLIREYEEAAHKRLRKGFLADRIRKYEIDNGDARLVRGICTLLERKCIFVNTMEQKQNKLTFALEIPQLDSKELRRNLFEESARREIALNIDKRNEIIRTVSSRLGIDQDLVQDLIWNDLDENFRLQSFLGLEPTALAAWYNLALVQTLLFSCNNLEFSLQGGTRWKGVLREVKRQGLMYSMRSQKSADYSTSGLEKISCSVDGPLSVLKMTEIYGTALAKLIPYIIDSKGWSIQASIVRNSLTSGKKVYDFQLTNDVAPTMSLPFHYSNGYGLASSRSAFDSGLEEKFAVKFV